MSARTLESLAKLSSGEQKRLKNGLARKLCSGLDAVEFPAEYLRMVGIVGDIFIKCDEDHASAIMELQKWLDKREGLTQSIS